ncbi:Rubisco LSMT substrate-binding, putative [Leishmania lindenbergi]|uniref:Rubisco LSMT substrate-binding n=1 Tax=Leishmania lindenbergi TaxID=651832 RepID=A0AAW3A4E6_9TRYP
MPASAPLIAAVQWFTTQLNNSENAEVKRHYLRWYAEDTGASYSDEDPLLVQAILASCTGWTLPELLWRARLVVLDARTLWECLDVRMIAGRMHDVVDPWNEQLSVKLVWYFIKEQQPDESLASSSLNALRTALDEYAAATIKPQGSLSVTVSSSARSIGRDAQPSRCSTLIDAWSDKVALIPMEAGNGYSEGSLYCTAPVPSGGTLLQVPRTEMFFLSSLLQYCALGRAIAAEPSLRDLLENEEAMLVLCLVYERFVEGVERSHWGRLLTHCPGWYPTMPIAWELGDLAELDGLDMLDDVLAKRSQLQAFADQLQTSILPLLHRELSTLAGAMAATPSLADMSAAFAWEHLVWAQSTFNSRAFNLNVDGTVLMALVPLADMINHSNHTDVLVRKVEPNGGPFTMQVGAALTTADVGRELWMSYGPLQNWELLQHYGFVLGPDNVHDRLPFPLTVSAGANEPHGESDATDTLALISDEGGTANSWDARRLALIRRYALYLPGRCWIRHDGVPPPALLALLRVQLAQADEFDAMEGRRHGPFEPLSPLTEAAVVSVVNSTVQCVLKSFPTSLAEDEETLAELHDDEECDPHAGSESSRNYVLCLQLRVGLKRIANRCLEWCACHS